MLNQVFFNREPLTPSHFAALPLTAIEPKGWLLEQLETAAAGITGQLHKFWPDVRDSAWRGGAGDAWERAPYYLDGLVPLGYLLNDRELIEAAKPYIEWTLGSQTAEGQFGPSSNGDWWPRMVMLKVLRQYYTATVDKRVPEFMLRYFAYQYKTIDDRPLAEWAVVRAADNMQTALWLYNLTGKQFLIELCRKLRAQMPDWTSHFHVFPHTRPMSKLIPWQQMETGRKSEPGGLTGKDRPYYALQYHLSHVVNVAMALKYPGVNNLFRSNSKELTGFDVGFQKLMKHHGVAYGMFTGDEHLNGSDPTQGTECCAVVELMYTVESLLDGCVPPDGLGDLLEKLAFNALPATLTKDMTGHQYLQQANQVKCTIGKRPWYNNGDDSNTYGLEPNFGCCTANLHQGWPKYAASLWYATDDGGFAAVSYAPCNVKYWSEGVPIRIEVETNYPFEETICIRVYSARCKRIPIRLRIPAWADGAFAIMPDETRVECKPGTYVLIEREWTNGDAIMLTLPMVPRVTRWHQRTAAVELGPLLMAYEPKAKRSKIKSSGFIDDWSVEATSDWNWALTGGAMQVVHSDTQPGIFGSKPGVCVEVQAAQIPEWTMNGENCAAPPIEPKISARDIQTIRLIPYGGTDIRISQFPMAAIRGDEEA